MSVRVRFATTVAAVIALTVLLFSTSSIVAIDRALRSSFAARLHTSAQAVATKVDLHHGRISLDANDLRELAALHADTPFAVVDARETLLGGAPVPNAPAAHSLLTATAPVMGNGVALGSVTVWQSDAWIGDFERDAALVSIVLGLLSIGIGVAIADRVAQSFEGVLDRLEAAFARERRFVGDASHELRAPLAVLRAETELALRQERTDDEYRAALQSIARETVRLEDLVEDLLATARADADALRRERLDAGELVRRIGDRVRPAAAVLEVDVAVDASESAFVDANPAMLERALLAILHNAIAFARDRGCVRLVVRQSDQCVEIDVADDGDGFSADALQHATERFWRGNPARARGGTGLGLAIARALLEANGGTLQLANAPDGGAIVSVRFPECG